MPTSKIVPALGLEGYFRDPTFSIGLEGLRAGVAVDLQAQVFDHAHERVVAALIDLAAHEDGRVLQNVGLHGLGRLDLYFVSFWSTGGRPRRRRRRVGVVLSSLDASIAAAALAASTCRRHEEAAADDGRADFTPCSFW